MIDIYLWCLACFFSLSVAYWVGFNRGIDAAEEARRKWDLALRKVLEDEYRR